MNYLDLLAGTIVNADSGVVYGGGSLDIRVFAKRIGDLGMDDWIGRVYLSEINTS